MAELVGKTWPWFFSDFAISTTTKNVGRKHTKKCMLGIFGSSGIDFKGIKESNIPGIFHIETHRCG